MNKNFKKASILLLSLGQIPFLVGPIISQNNTLIKQQKNTTLEKYDGSFWPMNSEGWQLKKNIDPKYPECKYSYLTYKVNISKVEWICRFEKVKLNFYYDVERIDFLLDAQQIFKGINYGIYDLIAFGIIKCNTLIGAIHGDYITDVASLSCKKVSFEEEETMFSYNNDTMYSSIFIPIKSLSTQVGFYSSKEFYSNDLNKSKSFFSSFAFTVESNFGDQFAHLEWHNSAADHIRPFRIGTRDLSSLNEARKNEYLDIYWIPRC